MGGLGETISAKMAGAGYRVAVTYSPSNKTADKWLSDMKGRGYDFRAYGVDVADFDSCKQCVEQVTADLGPVDILVNNAGITRDMTFRKMTKADWDVVMHTNLDSVFNMSKQVCDGMVERGWGRLILVTSIAATLAAPGASSYIAAKAGLEALARALASELGATGVTSNALSPGFFATETNAALIESAAGERLRLRCPVRRWADPSEITGAAIFLASPAASYVNGHTLTVDGGVTATYVG